MESALVALLDRVDHVEVRAAFTDLAEAELVSHGYVVAETLTVTRRRLGVDATVAFRFSDGDRSSDTQDIMASFRLR